MKIYWSLGIENTRLKLCSHNRQKKKTMRLFNLWFLVFFFFFFLVMVLKIFGLASINVSFHKKLMSLVFCLTDYPRLIFWKQEFAGLVQYSRMHHFGKIEFSVELKFTGKNKKKNSRFSESLKSNGLFLHERNKTLKTNRKQKKFERKIVSPAKWSKCTYDYVQQSKIT